LLYKQQIIDYATLQRIFELSEHFGSPEDLPLGSLADILLNVGESDPAVHVESDTSSAKKKMRIEE
jgi:hypothetical protein